MFVENLALQHPQRIAPAIETLFGWLGVGSDDAQHPQRIAPAIETP